LAIKRLIVVEKEQNVFISYFKLFSFVGGSAKYYFFPGAAGHPSYATV